MVFKKFNLNPMIIPILIIFYLKKLKFIILNNYKQNYFTIKESQSAPAVSIIYSIYCIYY